MPDKYVNRAFIQTTESAAGTLTFTRLTTGVSLFGKQAFVISRIDWYFTQYDQLVASADYLQAAITTSNKMTGLGLDDPAVVCMKEWHGQLWGTAANCGIFSSPDVEDLSSLPGGGFIVPADPIFLAVQTQSFGSAGVCSARIYFTVVDLKSDEYLELVEAVRLIE